VYTWKTDRGLRGRGRERQKRVESAVEERVKVGKTRDDVREEGGTIDCYRLLRIRPVVHVTGEE
jgi:hypothetical protein